MPTEGEKNCTMEQRKMEIWKKTYSILQLLKIVPKSSLNGELDVIGQASLIEKKKEYLIFREKKFLPRAPNMLIALRDNGRCGNRHIDDERDMGLVRKEIQSFLSSSDRQPQFS